MKKSKESLTASKVGLSKAGADVSDSAERNAATTDIVTVVAIPRKQDRRPFTADELANLPDEEIDYSDIPELDEEFWQNAELVLPDNKERITLRVDQDVVAYFRRGGRGYQTRINAVLRAYVHMQESKHAHPRFDLR